MKRLLLVVSATLLLSASAFAADPKPKLGLQKDVCDCNNLGKCQNKAKNLVKALRATKSELKGAKDAKSVD